MSTKPRVSVLLPVRNAATTLEGCLRSLSRQSLADFECVLVDDGSTDESLAIARAFARTDPRVRVVALPASGLVATLSTGLERCRGTRIARMDADDLAHRERFAVQWQALEADDSLALVGAWPRAFPSQAFGDGTREYVRWLHSLRTPDDAAREAFVECPVLHPTWMAGADVFRRYGYRDLGFAEDWDLLLRLRANGLAFAALPRTLHAWRRSATSATTTDARYGEEQRVRLRAHHLCEGPLRAGPDYVLWGHGSTGKALRKALLAHGRRPVAIVELDPRKLGQRVDCIAVVGPGALAEGSPLRALPVVCCVAHEAPRRALRERLRQLGLREGRDFVCAA